VVASAARLNARLAEITMGMRGVLSSEITELDGEPRLVELLGASIESNVEVILHILQHNISAENVEQPSAAVEYARRLAQRGVPVTALVRAYRLGQDFLLKVIFDEIGRQADDPSIGFYATQHVVTATFRYVDWISQQLVEVYEQERARWLHNQYALRIDRIQALLDGKTDVAATEAALGYAMRQHHLGVIVWLPEEPIEEGQLPRLEQLVTALGRELSCTRRPLFCARDRSSGWGWLPLGSAVPSVKVVGEAAAQLADVSPDCRLALGAPSPGVGGFRDTHRQALAAQRVAAVAGDDAESVISYGQPGVRAAALLCADLEQTRSLVRDTLGRLAIDDPQRARLRETLLTFLSTANNYTATAELLTMHKNTVKYRVARAEEERGAPIGEDRLAVELALTACQWLRREVLLAPTDSA
jgi:DNA-binding PucR family transcriptional regulator